MAKENYLSRYALIIARLEKGPATYKEIARYLEQNSDIYDTDLNISQRTFQRDIKDIFTLIGYDIQNELKGDKRYFITDRPEGKQHSQRLLESFQIMNALRNIRGFEDIVLLERRRAKGLEHFNGLLYAINEKRIISFEYTKFQDDIPTDRVVHPLAVKESQGRWYLIAVDTKDNKLKVFGLDRINALDIHKSSFKVKYQYDLAAFFSNAFGVNTEGKTEPTVVRLCFDYEQGQYINSYPLHESQSVIKENENEFIIELNIYVTWDFIKELLSFGPSVKVLKPASLQNSLKALLKETLQLYV